MSTLRDSTAVVGIGATEFSKDSGRSELRLAVEAVSAAVEDAGLKLEDVDRAVRLRDGQEPGDRGVSATSAGGS